MTKVIAPADKYAQALSLGEFVADDAQAMAVGLLDEVWHSLMQRYQAAQGGLRFFKRNRPPKGVYMWGGVGRGKTWLMDMFYESIPFRRKMRLHFHHFMQRVHQKLNELKGQPDPLQKVADSIYADAVVICFDEFFVSHVSDAMILGDLFTLLFDKGVTLVATSNIEPNGLYKNGIHRDRFLPAINALTAHTQVLNIDIGIDYRLRVLQQADLFHTPLSDDARNWMAKRFAALTKNQHIEYGPIHINEREVIIEARTENVLWCDFRALCMQPRSAVDFIEIANNYSTVLVSGVPSLDDNLKDPTRRFIYLVDEFYDRRVKLIVTANEPILTLYSGQKLAFEIERTRSRLLEMQSEDYLQMVHRLD